VWQAKLSQAECKIITCSLQIQGYIYALLKDASQFWKKASPSNDFKPDRIHPYPDLLPFFKPGNTR
jgi:hypothetical protein